MTVDDAADRTRDHWWWRPGWRLGRSFYTWHMTFSNHPEIHQLAADYQPVISQFPTMDRIPIEGLHLTIQGVGFSDEVEISQLTRIVEATRRRCARIDPFDVMIGPAGVHQEALLLPVRPPEPIAEVRRALRDGIGDVWGTDNVPESMSGFVPHVSISYSNGVVTFDELDMALGVTEKYAASVTISAVSMIELNRDNKRYEWTEIAAIDFDGAGQP